MRGCPEGLPDWERYAVENKFHGSAPTIMKFHGFVREIGENSRLGTKIAEFAWVRARDY